MTNDPQDSQKGMQKRKGNTCHNRFTFHLTGDDLAMAYDPFFLGDKHEVPLPGLVGKTAEEALESGRVYDFTHFSIAMNKRRRFAIFSAACVDESRFLQVPRDNKSWHFDDRIGKENQVGAEFYANNEYDRGHLTRRKDVCWGERQEAEKANYDSFCYANIALQHHRFNTGIWNCLEDWILDSLDNDKKMIVITGPIHKESDEEYCGANGKPGCGITIPFGFWKMVCYADRQQALTCLSFLIRQGPDHPAETCAYQRWETYQVPLATIAEEAGLAFVEQLHAANPLSFQPGDPRFVHHELAVEKQLIAQPSDIVMSRDSK